MSNQDSLKRRQRKCRIALAVYTDLAEAVCELMLASQDGPLAPEQRARLVELRAQENEALLAYLNSRMNLLTALSIPLVPGDGAAWVAHHRVQGV